MRRAEPLGIFKDQAWFCSCRLSIGTTSPTRFAGMERATTGSGSVAAKDSILGVYAAVTRRTLDGKNPDGWAPEPKGTVGEALRAYTWGNAWATFNEHHWGALAPGNLADVVVLDRALFGMPADSLDRARVRYTLVGGAVVFSR
jgi:predicted amidohydrolase YtcJ